MYNRSMFVFYQITTYLYPCPMLRERDKKSQIDYTQIVLFAPLQVC